MVYIVDEILKHWLTTGLVIGNVGLWIFLNQRNVPVQQVSFNYKLIVEDGEWWRIVTSAFSHYNFFHILFNMLSLWSYRFMEYPLLGVIGYIKVSWIILVVSSISTLVIYKLFIWKLNWQHYRNDVHAVGYSAIIFGLLTVGSLANPTGKLDLLFGLRLPMWVVPFFYLIVSSLLFPQASFVGHLSGIIAGLLIRFYVFIWLINPVFYVLFPIFVLIMLYTLGVHKRIPYLNNFVARVEDKVKYYLSFIPRVRLPSTSSSSTNSGSTSGMTIVNGRLVSRSNAEAAAAASINNQTATSAPPNHIVVNVPQEQRPDLGHTQVDLTIDDELYNTPPSQHPQEVVQYHQNIATPPIIYTQNQMSNPDDDFDELAYTATSEENDDQQGLLSNDMNRDHRSK